MIIKNAEVNGIIKDILLEKCLIAKIDNNISGSNFYDAKERIDEYAFGWAPHDHNEYKETQDK